MIRDFITLLGSASAWPITAWAQRSDTRRIGVLLGSAKEDAQLGEGLMAFTKSLAELGWVRSRPIGGYP